MNFDDIEKLYDEQVMKLYDDVIESDLIGTCFYIRCDNGKTSTWYEPEYNHTCGWTYGNDGWPAWSYDTACKHERFGVLCQVCGPGNQYAYWKCSC